MELSSTWQVLKDKIILANEPPLRADAQRNKERILAAAEELFLTKGAGVSLEDVAKHAGVGIGTLYRRFPTREALLAAAYSDRFLAFAEASRARAPTLGPLCALEKYLEELVQYTNIYRGIAASLGTVLEVGTPGCIATSEEGSQLLHDGKMAGVVRADISFNDLVCIVTAISLITEQYSSPKSHISHLVGMFLGGIALS